MSAVTRAKHTLTVRAEPNRWGTWDVYVDCIWWRRYGVLGDRLVHIPLARKDGIVVDTPLQSQIEQAIFERMKEQRSSNALPE